jgi:hypothetical protein
MIRAALLAFVLISAVEARGSELLVKEHGFAVTLSGTPQGGAPRPDGSTAWKVQSGGVDYSVLVAPLNQPRPPDDVLGAMAGQIPTKLKVTSDRYLARQGRAGREYLAEDAAGHAMRLLAFADNDDARVYLVMAEGQRNAGSDAAVRAVFDSFRFLVPRRAAAYAAPDGTYRMTFPGSVRTTTGADPRQEGEHNGFMYELRVLALPAGDTTRQLDMVRDNRLQQGLRLIQESRLKVSGLAAIEIVTEDKDGVAQWTARAIADPSRRRMYLLSVLAPKARAQAVSPAAAAFFDTLRLGNAGGS